MSIFIQFEGVEGSASAAGHEQWSEIASVHFSSTRSLRMQVGEPNDRRGLPGFGHLMITKEVDASSPKLFSLMCKGQVVPTVKIDLCRTGAELTPHLQYSLANVMIAEFDESIISGTGVVYESFALNYTQIEKRYITRDSANQDQAPYSVSFNLETAMS